jgi:preprotein translocase subunit SecF
MARLRAFQARYPGSNPGRRTLKMENREKKFSIKNFHNKYYKLLLLIPLTLFILSSVYIISFYYETGDFIRKDISLTGGTSVTIPLPLNPNQIMNDLSSELENTRVRGIYDLITGEQIAVTIETQSELSQTKQALENYLGYELNEENSTFRFTGTSISEAFYRQLIVAILLAFLMMGAVVFIIFGTNSLIKFYSATLVLFGLKAAYSNVSPFVNGIVSVSLLVVLGIAFFYSFKHKRKKIVLILLTLIAATLFIFPSFYARNALFIIISLFFFLLAIYIKHNIPAFAVILSAALNILMTLALVNFLGMSLSRAGIVAFLMIIGYSVDTDILLTTKMIKRTEGTLNERILGAMKTGVSMTLTSLLAVGFALIIVRSFSDILSQIFTIMIIGLSFDLVNTWITNVSILKWHLEAKK